MEGAPPPAAEHGSNKKDSKESTAKTEKASEKVEAPQPDSWLERLTGADKKVEDSPEDSPEAASEAESAELSPEEAVLGAQELLEAIPEPSFEAPAIAETPEEKVAEDLVVEQFRDKIINEDKTIEVAFNETLGEVADILATPEVVTEAEPETEPEAEPPAQEFTDEAVEIARQQPLEVVATEVPEAEPKPVPPKPTNRDWLISGITERIVVRRNKRQKVEKQPAKTEKKVEQQVRNLQAEITTKELTLRKAATEQVRAKKPEKTRLPATEASQLHGQKVSPERIGGVLIYAEAENHPNIEKAKALPADKHVETLTRTDLLELSSKIIFDGTSLREIYESHLVSEKGLRRLVAEHLRGGNVRKALKREMLEREIDFERDPQLRDRASHSQSAGGKTALNNLLQKVEIGATTTDRQELAVLQAREAYELGRQEQQRHSRRLIDISLVTTIVILLALITALIITRG